jgi:hypothetical protein
MKISEVKSALSGLDSVNFKLPNGKMIPSHFHVTELGIITKHFIDCGGTVRNEKVANFQLWEANDFDHRLAPNKLLGIIDLSERVLGLEDLDIEVEYQIDTIGKYELGFDGHNFTLLNKQTACLAMDSCGIPKEQLKEAVASCCTPDGGCC